MLGCFILAFGWFGFNPGRTLAASGNGALRIGSVAVNTMLAGMTACFGALIYMWCRGRQAGRVDANRWSVRVNCLRGSEGRFDVVTRPAPTQSSVRSGRDWRPRCGWPDQGIHRSTTRSLHE